VALKKVLDRLVIAENAVRESREDTGAQVLWKTAVWMKRQQLRRLASCSTSSMSSTRSRRRRGVAEGGTESIIRDILAL